MDSRYRCQHPISLADRPGWVRNRGASLRKRHQCVDDGLGQEGAAVGQRAHVGELDGRPFPAAGLAAHDGEGGHALHGEGEEDQQRDRAARAEVVPKGRLQADDRASRLHTVKGAEGAHDHLARG